MISAQVRRTVRILYAFSCGYCGVAETEVGAYLTIDHYIPRDAGGTDDISNLVYACHACNMHKSAAWDSQSPPILHPLRTDMSVHIAASDDGILRGLTPEGIRHIEVLHLNRPPMIERRRVRRLLHTLLEIEAQRLMREKELDREMRAKTRRIRRKKKQSP
jgi:hypothetical protein